jgi:hypothetical protein
MQVYSENAIQVDEEVHLAHVLASFAATSAKGWFGYYFL